MCTNYFFDKCNRCHVIDIVVQLYMTVGLVITLKTMSVRSWRWTSLRLPRNPRIAARVFLKRANLNFVLMYIMTDAYGSLRFSAIFSASLLLPLLHSCAIPPCCNLNVVHLLPKCLYKVQIWRRQTFFLPGRNLTSVHPFVTWWTLLKNLIFGACTWLNILSVITQDAWP